MIFIVILSFLAIVAGLGGYLLYIRCDEKIVYTVSCVVMFGMMLMFVLGGMLVGSKCDGDKSCPICGETYSDTDYEYCPADGAELEVIEK